MVPRVFHLDPVFSTWCWVFHQTPYFSPELTCSVSTSPCVFHQTPCIPHPVISHPPGPRSLGPHTDIFHQALLKFLFSGCCMWIKKKTDHMMTNISSPQFAAQLLLKNREFRAIVSIDRFCICKHFLAKPILNSILLKKSVKLNNWQTNCEAPSMTAGVPLIIWSWNSSSYFHFESVNKTHDACNSLKKCLGSILTFAFLVWLSQLSVLPNLASDC